MRVKVVQGTQTRVTGISGEVNEDQFYEIHDLRKNTHTIIYILFAAISQVIHRRLDEIVMSGSCQTQQNQKCAKTI